MTQAPLTIIGESKAMSLLSSAITALKKPSDCGILCQLQIHNTITRLQSLAYVPCSWDLNVVEPDMS